MNKDYQWDIKSPRPRLVVKAKPKRRWRKVITVSAVVLLLIASFAGVGAFNLWRAVKQSGGFILSSFREAAGRLVNLEIEKARGSFAEINQEIDRLRGQADRYGLLEIADINSAFSSLSVLGKSAFAVSSDLEELKNDGFGWLMNQRGDLLIANLERLHSGIVSLGSASQELQTLASRTDLALAPDYVAVAVQLTSIQQFLDALIGWLKTSANQHLLVLFQNPSEIRPAGGFVGSYAVLTLRQGGVVGIGVRDVYDPDGQLEEKIVPPRILQLLTPRWGARDANWFFDFPTSAKKVAEFLERSKIYKEQFTKFNGVLAINIGVVRDIVSIVGPIELPQYQITIDENNILSEIQREVESGEDKLAGEPKRILKVLTPVLLERIGQLDDVAKQELIKKLSDRIAHKDILMYFKDLAIQGYLQALGIGGEVKELPSRWSGGYLAVVNANIASGKTDAFIQQTIDWDISVDLTGEVTNHLVVRRAHSGNTQKDYWYRVTNKDYIQILVPSESELASVKGNSWRKITPPLDYAAKGYLVDPDVAAIENSRQFLEEFSVEKFRAFGKDVFGTWLFTDPGKTGVLEVAYTSPQKFFAQAGEVYELVYEKQSGVSGPVKITLRAPGGYIWRESDSPVLEYKTENPEQRINIRATLAALPE